MNKKDKAKTLSEKEIDEIIVAQADDDSAWEEPIRVCRAAPSSVPLSPVLAELAVFFARLHHETSVEDWLTRVIKERIDLEEAALAELKRELTVKTDG